MILFNANDLFLLLTVAGCSLVLLVLLVTGRARESRRRNILLGVFLLAIAAESLDTLIYWSKPLKQLFFANSPHVFFVLKAVILLQGSAVYLYVTAFLDGEFKFRRQHLYHLLPLAVYPLLLSGMYRSLDPKQLLSGVMDYDLWYANFWFRLLIFLQDGVVLLWAMAALWLVVSHRRARGGGLAKSAMHWLILLTAGFLAVSLWKYQAPVFHRLGFGMWAHESGLLGNYLDFFLVTAFLCYCVTHQEIIRYGAEGSVRNGTGPERFTRAQVNRLLHAVRERELYLQSDLTLEQLAEEAGTSARVVSGMLNRKFNMNFFEFINFHRVERAKQILRQCDKKPNMLDVMHSSGFNSKSAFNRFFKKCTGMTPTEFRDTGADAPESSLPSVACMHR